jgi:hypothetical protein
VPYIDSKALKEQCRLDVSVEVEKACEGDARALSAAIEKIK